MELLDQFYSTDARRDSDEIPIGSNWRSTRLPRYEFSVFWIANTQELCALRTPIRDVAHDGPVRRWILGIPPHTRTQGFQDFETTVAVLAMISETDLRERLAGWEAHNHAPDGFDWLRRIVAT